ncbi:sugar transferase [Rubritalea marina]|uniref:sugar transferase n=1 Tax=Rubritalea marina TaxID=361055 RepID=UPI0004780121|nr:sugar transferase [Rubritalea marina]
MMSEEELALRLSRQLVYSSNPLRRWWLSRYVKIKGLLWKVTIQTAKSIKRLIDLISSGVLILILSPILILIALIIRKDGGPVFFKQSRVGYRGREFGMLKFRSMCVDAEARLADLMAQNEKKDGITFKMENDPRVTSIGRFIRKTSIDEIPQLINVWKGEMSLVGPRPPLPKEVEKYSLEDRRRLLATPGMTCLWQIGEREGKLFEVGDRNQIEFDEQVGLDVKYIESQSLIRDLLILVKTVPAVLLGKGGV